MKEIGDRIYYENTNGEVDSAVILEIKEDTYADVNGNEVKFNWYLIGAQNAIEDYKCLPKNHPKVTKYLAEKANEYWSLKDKQQQEVYDFVISKGWAVDNDGARGFLLSLFDWYSY